MVRFVFYITSCVGLLACSNSTVTASEPEALVPKQTQQREEAQFRLLHFNIKELSTPKFFMNSAQVVAAADIVREARADFISLNEIQYDKKDIPIKEMPGEGNNPERLLQSAGLDSSAYFYSFFEANTGKNAQRLASGEYLLAPNSESLRVADHANFGIFPGQYSTAFVSRFPISQQIQNSELKWSEWDPSLDLSAYELGDKSPVPPGLELFDKNFTDSIVRIKDKDVHFITFHTVPAFNFGNPKGFNHLRNAAQLEFLEWYLFGACEKESESLVRSCRTDLRPLSKDAIFVVVGDLNTDLHSKDPGAVVLKRIYENPRVHNRQIENRDPLFTKQKEDPHSLVTYMGDGNDLKVLQLQLDYFIFSKDWKIHDLYVFAPPSNYVEHVCHENKAYVENEMKQLGLIQGRVSEITERKNDDKLSYCLISVSSGFAQRRRASDHLPAIAEVSLP